MSSIEQNLSTTSIRELPELLDYIHSMDCGHNPARIKESMEKIGDSALSAGYPGIFELCATIITSLNEYPDITESIKTDLLYILNMIDRYLAQSKSDDIKDSIIQSVSNSFLMENMTEDQIIILKDMLDLVIESDNQKTNTELAEATDNTVLPENGSATTASFKTFDDSGCKRTVNINNNIPDELKELLQIMQSELIPIDRKIRNVSFQLLQGAPLGKVADELQDCISTLDLFCDAVDSFDFKGLAFVIRHVRNNITLPDKQEDHEKFRHAMRELQPLLDYIFDYLGDPHNTGNINEIIDHLKKPLWFSPLADSDIDEIGKFLHVNTQYKSDDNVPDANDTFTPDDVSLSLPEDIDRDLLDALLHELPDQIEELSLCINRFQDNGTLDDIQTAKRIAHTLKGAGNTVGIRGIAMLTHKMEDILLSLYKNNVMPPEGIQNILIRACDCLSAMSDYLLETGDEPSDSLEVLQQIADISNQIQKNGIQIDDNISGKSPVKITSNTEKRLPDTNSREEPVKSIKVPMAFMDQLLKLVGESITSNKQIISSLHETIELVKNNKGFYKDLRFFGDKIEEIIATKDIYSGHNYRGTNDFDDLEMDRFSDLHVYVHQLIEKTVDVEEATQYFLDHLVNLDEKLIELGRINTQIKQNVESNRLIPVSNHSSRLQRIVRQAANLADKKVALEIHGLDTYIDSDVLNNLINSLIHLLRNAVDHGIEHQDGRINLGKNPAGKIDLSFSADNNEIRIICEDDGRGLDKESIRAKAIEIGLLNEKDNISEQDIEKLIFHPDFSTRSETTELSGRGIGLDAVHSSITELSGTINITTTPHKGTRFEIVLPSNRMIVNVLLVGMGSEILSVSTRGIDQVFYHDQVVFHDSRDHEIQHVEINNTRYQAVTLESILQINYERRTSNRRFPLIILFSKSRHEKLAVLVDRIHGCENMVLKTMGNYVPKIPGIMGISMLGDGNITSVIDIVELANSKQDYSYSRKHRHIIEKQLPTALVVDDSLSVRKSLTEFMENIGYNVRSAHDGIEAFEIASACRPNIIITDMEMPRMNGIELTSHIRSSADMKDIPVIMITSRSADRHMKEASDAGINAYITKPYSEEELLDTIKRLNISAKNNINSEDAI